jgi:hypothetical protein
MSNFGNTLFGGSPFVRWAISPFLLIFIVSFPFLISGWTPTRILLVVGTEIVCLALLAGLWLPANFGRWAFRGVAAIVFLAYGAYLVVELLFSNQPFRLFDNPGNASPRNAIIGFFVIGMPCMWYALFGRFTLRPN